MTSSPSDVTGFAARVADAVGGEVVEIAGTAKVTVSRDRWVAAATAARDDLGLAFFDWLSGVDWSNGVAVGDPPAEEVEERFEVLCALSDVTDGNLVVLSSDVPKDDAAIESLVSVYPGANWHEREAAEMFGIEFRGHPDPGPLYLPESFAGHPLRKQFPLLSRDVKPWPGKVDVEDMPTTENPGR